VEPRAGSAATRGPRPCPPVTLKPAQGHEGTQTPQPPRKPEKPKVQALRGSPQIPNNISGLEASRRGQKYAREPSWQKVLDVDDLPCVFSLRRKRLDIMLGESAFWTSSQIPGDVLW
jgi:hypothetical protein